MIRQADYDCNFLADFCGLPFLRREIKDVVHLDVECCRGESSMATCVLHIGNVEDPLISNPAIAGLPRARRSCHTNQTGAP